MSVVPPGQMSSRKTPNWKVGDSPVKLAMATPTMGKTTIFSVRPPIMILGFWIMYWKSLVVNDNPMLSISIPKTTRRNVSIWKKSGKIVYVCFCSIGLFETNSNISLFSPQPILTAKEGSRETPKVERISKVVWSNMRTLVNKIFSKYLEYRMEANRRFMASPYETQQRVLMDLVKAHADTEWGRLHGFDRIKSPADYARQVPVQTYLSLQPFIERMMHGEPDVLYTGFVEWFAKSSGTTGAVSVYVPGAIPL